jgi:hypothetical protein
MLYLGISNRRKPSVKLLEQSVPPLFSLHLSIIHDHIFQARERHNFLNRYPHGWPIEEFIKTYLKNKRTYARKQGYLMENTNQKQHRHDDEDDDEDEEEEEGQQQQQKEQEEEESQEEGNDKETEGGNGWLNRGDGWHRGPTDEDIYGSDVPA